MPETQPEVYTEFKKGLYTIKRTSKPFSESPIDLTLEKTFNADAASQRSRIVTFLKPHKIRKDNDALLLGIPNETTPLNDPLVLHIATDYELYHFVLVFESS
ncbi:unnamed protein product [Lepeophtheirus salmonis]|uniref:(salmon louse) hypothetical protein n=1 Tax=Lepeophtheirus salmonis TaxID=72036 RepID=A0A7R8CFT3_LEPSM|nr:unnamed protein product [Lepeophtheirus salmonis]CAF2809426.1 unnamed protein product [Lepeophtheirus salmonis]